MTAELNELLPKEKKFRPYTIKEFFDKFTVTQPIKFRLKKFRPKGKRLEWYLILKPYVGSKRGVIKYVYIGSAPYTLDELFNDYEYQNTLGKWVPFGVEE